MRSSGSWCSRGRRDRKNPFAIGLSKGDLALQSAARRRPEPASEATIDSSTTSGADAARPAGESPIGPESLAWRLGLDRRALLVAGRALMTQVMHPVISAAVEDFSSFRTDPWGRLDRTVTSLVTQIFGGPAAAAEGRRLRELHRSIKGIGPHGSRYTALDPEAYAWTHLSNFDAALVMHNLFGNGLTPAQQERLYAEWRQIGTTLGLADRYLPPDLDAFRGYVDETVRQRLENTPTSSDLLGMIALDDVPPPPSLPLAGITWPLARPLGRLVLRETTIGTLPPAAREKLGLQWSASQERRLRGFAALVRATVPLVPERVRDYPMAYRAKQAARRYEALQRHG